MIRAAFRPASLIGEGQVLIATHSDGTGNHAAKRKWIVHPRVIELAFIVHVLVQSVSGSAVLSRACCTGMTLATGFARRQWPRKPPSLMRWRRWISNGLLPHCSEGLYRARPVLAHRSRQAAASPLGRPLDWSRLNSDGA